MVRPAITGCPEGGERLELVFFILVLVVPHVGDPQLLARFRRVYTRKASLPADRVSVVATMGS